jgi:hypothetical protein
LVLNKFKGTKFVMRYNYDSIIDTILSSRAKLPRENIRDKKSAEEGGCGVTGFISSIPVSGRHIFEPSIQMHNRGNGKGGGIAAVGLSADDLGVTQDILDTHYMLQVACSRSPCSILNHGRMWKNLLSSLFWK